MSEVKQEVKEFYDQVGWKLVGEDVYQNARYEDLRPVASEYIHKCHQRISRHLALTGRLLLDAGSGPVQYPEYLEYSRGYRRRVCADISITALKEARRRLGEHGLYVVADVANLPFKAEAFDGVVSLHTLHHLPEEEHLPAYRELYRVLAPGAAAAIVNGWAQSPFVARFEPLIRFANNLRHAFYRLTGRRLLLADEEAEGTRQPRSQKRRDGRGPTRGEAAKGTFTNKHNAAWVKQEVGAVMPVEILVWRSVTVRLTRALIHPLLAGRYWLRLLYNLEERDPHYYGENGKYPLIVIRKDLAKNRETA
jgi:SAM-dependent methyltransferase